MNSDSQIHLGHRERMRRKLLAYGAEIFDTYELLEMLLYSVIPVRDTNPLAKRLLAAFGSLDNLFCATREELMCVDGVGSATADYIATVGALPMIIPTTPITPVTLADYDRIGEYLVGYYRNKQDYLVSALLLDNALRPIKVEDVYTCDYGKGCVQAKPFLDLAFSLGASCAVIAHNHPFGPLYPSHSDLLTHKVLAEGFKNGRMTLLDHYLVSGDGYIRIGKMATEANGVDRLYNEFGIVCIKSDVSPLLTDGKTEGDAGEAYLDSYLGYSVTNEEKRRDFVRLLMERYHSLEGVIFRDGYELSSVCGSAAVSLKLLAYVTSRRYTDNYRPGKKCGDWVGDYIKWRYFGESTETVRLMLFDKNDKFISLTKISEGTISASEITPRKAMDAAIKTKAAYAVMAHNHPGGTCVASRDDSYATAVVSDALAGVGVELKCHYVTTGLEVGEVKMPSRYSGRPEQ